MKKCLLFLLIGMNGLLMAQRDSAGTEPLPFKKRIVGGGSIGLSFGSVTTIGLAPIVGYKVTERFIVGVGVSYYYLKYHFVYQPPVSTYIYGGSVWARYIFLPKLFLAAESEELNSIWDPSGRPDYRSFRTTYLGGFGYREYNGSFSNYIELLYNFNQLESAYDSPIVIRAGFAFGM